MTGAAPPTRLDVAQQFVMHIGRREIDQVVELLAPSVTYRVLGHHALAGTFSGREEVSKHLVHLDDRASGTFDTIKYEDWMVGQDHVVGLAVISMGAAGRLFTGRAVFLFKFDGADRIVAIAVFFEDEDSAARFFGRQGEEEP
jgi:ketosteroid isomerase-like protein